MPWKRLFPRNLIRFACFSLALSFLWAFHPALCPAADVVIPVGTGPYQLAVTPDGKYVFVTNWISHNVSRIVVATAVEDLRIPVGYKPRGIDATPDSAHVYAANENPAGAGVHCSRIVTATGAVDQTMDPGWTSYDVAVTPDGAFIYVSNWWTNVVHKYSVATGGYITSIPVGQGPDSLGITPDGTFLYVGNQNSGTVSKIDLATDTVVGTTNLGNMPYAIKATPDSQYVYVAVGVTGVVRIVVATGAIDQTVALAADPYGLDISPDGRFVYAALVANDQVVKIDTETHTVVDTIDVGNGPYDVAVTPDGKYLFVPNFHDGTVTRIQLIQDGGDGTNPGPSPDLIPPGGPPHQLGGGGENMGPPLPPGHTWQPNGAGGTPQNLTMALAHLGGSGQAASARIKRNENIPGLMFQKTCPLGTVEEHWLPLGESGTMPNGVEYETGMRWNYAVRVLDLSCNWPQSVIQNMASGTHCLAYWLQTTEGLRSNPRVQYLNCGADGAKASFVGSTKAPVERGSGELTFKLQVSYFNREAGFVERIAEGMCEVEVDGATYGTFPIVNGKLTARIPFGQTSLIKFIAQEFKGYKRVRIEFVDGFMHAYDHDFRDAEVEVYQCLGGESYAIEYFRDLVYICNQGPDPEGPILGRMFR